MKIDFVKPIRGNIFLSIDKNWILKNFVSSFYFQAGLSQFFAANLAGGCWVSA